MRYLSTLILALAALSAGTAPAAAGCAASLVLAAAQYGVPPDLMLAIGHAESGWNAHAVNSDGIPHYPESVAAAVELVQREQARGVESIDVGCGQINLHWHRDAFADLAQAFDPERNADYAARFLADLYLRHGDWREAVARYHSGDPTAQRRYLERVDRRLLTLQDGAPPDYFASRETAQAVEPAPAGEPETPGTAAVAPIQPRIIGVAPGIHRDGGGRVIRVPGSPLIP